MCDMDFANYPNSNENLWNYEEDPFDYSGMNAAPAAPESNWIKDWVNNFNPEASGYMKDDQGNWVSPSTPSSSPSWYSGIGNGLSSVLTSPDVWKYGGLLGSILAATQTPGTTTKGATSQSSTPNLLPGAQAGVNEIMNNALPYAQANLLQPMGSEETTLYNYLMGGGGDIMSQLLGTGNQAQGYLQSGLQDLDINKLIAMVAPQITEATMKQFGPYAASKGGSQRQVELDLGNKAADFATQRATYQKEAAGLTPQISAAQTGIMSELMKLAGTPQTMQQNAYSSYMDTIRALLGLPAGTTGVGATTTTTPEQSIWQRLAPIFQGMSTTGTPTGASSGNTNTNTIAQLLSAMLKG